MTLPGAHAVGFPPSFIADVMAALRRAGKRRVQYVVTFRPPGSRLVNTTEKVLHPDLMREGRRIAQAIGCHRAYFRDYEPTRAPKVLDDEAVTVMGEAGLSLRVIALTLGGVLYTQIQKPPRRVAKTPPEPGDFKIGFDWLCGLHNATTQRECEVLISRLGVKATSQAGTAVRVVRATLGRDPITAWLRASA